MPIVNLGVGEFIDRYSILEIKSTKGLDVITEFEQYKTIVLEEFSNLPAFTYYCNILEVINEQLWDLEIDKRQVTRNTKTESDIAYLITQLNDIRSTTKKAADEFFASEIKEIKNYT